MRRTFLNASSLISLLLLLLSFCAGVQAQSGRRTTKAGSAQAPPVQPPQPQPTPAAENPPAQPQIQLIVVGDSPQSLYLSFAFPEKMQRWVIKRLRESGALAVTDGGNGNRPTAVKRAKGETEAFVIWVELNEDVFNPQINETTGRRNFERFQINYHIISPVTGKFKSSGVVQMRDSGPNISIGRSPMPPVCYPDVRDRADYRLLVASLEVADRIMSKLNVPLPPICPVR